MKKTLPIKRGTIVKTRKRIILISLAFLIFTAFLISNLFKLQFISNAYYKEKVYGQITTVSVKRAERGNIYDSDKNILATKSTVWRVFISTRDIKKAEKEENINYSEMIAYGLSSILNLSAEDMLAKIKNTNVLDVTVKKEIDDSEYQKVTRFISENGLERLVFLEAQTSRYYPEGTLLAHVLGFTGSDNQGLYGLEYYYNDYLKGQDGYYLYAKDANGNALDTEYSTFIEAKAGASIVTTIDSHVQRLLENQLALAAKNHSAQNRATGIVMDIKTGAIIAMATTSPFDPNNPYVLDELSATKLFESGYDRDSDEYKAYKKELLEIMWSNKAISETYEPGSTFKIITVSCALDSGCASTNDRFSCIGYHSVGGYRIKCHKVKGHGSGFNLAYGLQMSCNPTMMQLAERVGREIFYKYVEEFGYFEKSGIDLPSEASTIFHSLENIGTTELATASFGQRFKVTIINHLCAIATVANGGNAVTPYIVDKIIDADGSTIYEHQTEIKRRVISDDIANTVSKILEEGVSGDGGAKNAAVPGYKIAAKTGTSEKFDILDENGNSYLRTSSTVAYNIDEEGGIAVIIVVDEPQSQVKYGSIVAAPYVSAFLAEALPYLGYESELEATEITVPALVGESVSSAKEKLDSMKLGYEIIGDGDTVLSQTPEEEDIVSSSTTKIILYTVEKESYLTVPALVGKELSEAVKEATNCGLNIKIIGASDSGNVVYQSLPNGAIVKKGTVIEIQAMICDFED